MTSNIANTVRKLSESQLRRIDSRIMELNPDDYIKFKEIFNDVSHERREYEFLGANYVRPSSIDILRLRAYSFALVTSEVHLLFS